MCTVSFYPNGKNYLVGMNRDELFTRGSATPANIYEYQSMPSIHPTDSEGGTWIAVNAAGITFALLNWNSPPRTTKLRSRGEAILQVLPSYSHLDSEHRISRNSVLGMLPFRLVGFFPMDQLVREWRWNGTANLETLHFDWQPRHWFSSGLSDERAASERSRITEAAAKESNAGSVDWLRSLHGSHLPQRGAFSVCVHRDEAATLSYTEVAVASDQVTMRYRDGSPCLSSTFASERVLRRTQWIAAPRTSL
jgi:Transport and Golgi organisation 2